MRKFSFLAFVLIIFAGAGSAQSGPALTQLDVIPGWRTASGTHMAGIRVTLDQGWKTYWRAPGDAGIPPVFSYHGSSNIGAVRYHWPVPRVFHQSGMRSIGYHDSVVIPVEITPNSGNDPIRLAGSVQIGVCEEICIPVTLTFDAVLPTQGQRDGAITASLIDQPLSAAQAGIAGAVCQVTPTNRGLLVSVVFSAPPQPVDVVIEAGNPSIWVSEPEVTEAGNKMTAKAEFVHVNGGSFVVDRSLVRTTLLGADRAVDIRGCSAR